MALTRLQPAALQPSSFSGLNITDGSLYPVDLSTGAPLWDSTGSITIQTPNTSSSYLKFSSPNTTTAAMIGGYDDGTNSGHLEFYTKNAGTVGERVRIDSAGNVGINYTNMSTLGARFYSNGYSGFAATVNGGVSLGSRSNWTSTFENFSGSYGLGINVNAASGYVTLQSQRFDGTATAYDIALNPLGGNVIIGAAAGAYNTSKKLQVSSGLSVGYGLYTYATFDTNTTGDVILTSNANPANLGSNSNIIFKLGTSGGGGPIEAARISSTGNMSIGNTATDYRFTVTSDPTSTGGMHDRNGHHKAFISGSRPTTGSLTLRTWVSTYSSGILRFYYAHTNDGDNGAFIEVFLNNSYGTMRNSLIASKLTTGVGTFAYSLYSPGAGQGAGYHQITFPTANGSPGSYTATIEGTGSFWFQVV